MKNIYFLLFAILIFTYSYCQTNLDSLEIENKKNLKPKINSAVKIQLGRLKNMYGLDGAEQLVITGLNIAKQNNDSLQIAKAYETLGFCNERKGNLELAMRYADTCKSIIIQSKDTLRNFTLQLLYGELFRRKAKYAEALEHYLESAQTAEMLNNDDLKSKAYNALGVFYVNTKNFDQALKFHKQALAINEKLNNTLTIMNSLGNIGIVYKEQKLFNKALEYHLRAKALVLQTKDSTELSYQLNEIGVDYREMKNYPKAIENIKASIAIRERIKEQSEIAYSYNNLAKCFEGIAQNDSAEFYYKKALQTSLSIKNNRQTEDNYRTLSLFYEKKNQLDSAFAYSKLYNSMRDVLLEEDNLEKMHELTVKYNTKEQDLKIKEQQLAIRNRNIILLALVGIVGAIIFGLISRQKRKKIEFEIELKDVALKTQQLASAGIIEAEENERQRLSAEIHDGVGQLLGAANLQLQILKDQKSNQLELIDKASNFIKDGIDELRMISHNLTPPALLQDDLIVALKKFVQKLYYSKVPIHFFSEGWQTPLNKNKEIILYRIIQESINNILKHAQATQINITAIQEKNSIDITIEDNGIGFNTETLKDGLGLLNIKKRMKYLNGEIDIQSSEGNGTCIMLHLSNVN